MDKHKANKIIAKYMGVKIVKYQKSFHVMTVQEDSLIYDVDKYSESLDALKLPIEKLMKTHRTLTEMILSRWLVSNDYDMSAEKLAIILSENIEAIHELKND